MMIRRSILVRGSLTVIIYPDANDSPWTLAPVVLVRNQHPQRLIREVDKALLLGGLSLPTRPLTLPRCSSKLVPEHSTFYLTDGTLEPMTFRSTFRRANHSKYLKPSDFNIDLCLESLYCCLLARSQHHPTERNRPEASRQTERNHQEQNQPATRNSLKGNQKRTTQCFALKTALSSLSSIQSRSSVGNFLPTLGRFAEKAISPRIRLSPA